MLPEDIVVRLRQTAVTNQEVTAESLRSLLKEAAEQIECEREATKRWRLRALKEMKRA